MRQSRRDGDSARHAPQPRSAPSPVRRASNPRQGPAPSPHRRPPVGARADPSQPRHPAHRTTGPRRGRSRGRRPVLYVGAGGLERRRGGPGWHRHELRAGGDGDPGPVGPRADRAGGARHRVPHGAVHEPGPGRPDGDGPRAPRREPGLPRCGCTSRSKDQAPTPIDEKPLAPTAQMIIPVTLTKGINDFSRHACRSGRRVRVVAARPLGARHGSASHPPHLPEGRRAGQPQGGHARRSHPGPVDGQRSEHEDGRVDRRDGRR